MLKTKITLLVCGVCRHPCELYYKDSFDTSIKPTEFTCPASRGCEAKWEIKEVFETIEGD